MSQKNTPCRGGRPRKQKCKNCEGKGTPQEGRQDCQMPEVRGDWDQAVTKHDQDDVELAHRQAQGQYPGCRMEFRAFGYPRRKTGRPIEGGLNTLPACDSTYVADDPEAAVGRIVELVKTRIPKRFGLDPIRDIQVLCPMNRGGVGARSLNIELQAALNPASSRAGRSPYPFFLEGGAMNFIEKSAITTKAYWLRVYRSCLNFAQ